MHFPSEEHHYWAFPLTSVCSVALYMLRSESIEIKAQTGPNQELNQGPLMLSLAVLSSKQPLLPIYDMQIVCNNLMVVIRQYSSLAQ